MDIVNITQPPGLPLPEENLEEVPFGTSKCRLCRMPLKDLKEMHFLYFDEKYSYKKLRAWLKEKHGIGNDYGYMAKHLNRHCRAEKRKNRMIRSTTKNLAVVEILQECPTGIQSKRTNRNVEKAYDQLVKMTGGFTDVVSKLFERYKLVYGNSEELMKALEQMGPIHSLNLIAQLNRMAREQIKDVSAIRAPKVLVLQFLEDTFDRAIGEFNDVVGSLFLAVQDEFMKVMDQRGMKDAVSDKLFKEVFKKIALSYKERILTLRQMQLMRAADALQNLEKVV